MPINAINMLNTRPSAENTGFKGRKIQSEQTKVSKEPMVKIPLATLKTLLLASTIATAPMVTSCNSDEPLDDIIENPTTTTTNPKYTTVTKTPIEENNEKSPVQTTLKSILSTLGIIPTNTTRTYNATSGDLTNINYSKGKYYY